MHRRIITDASTTVAAPPRDRVLDLGHIPRHEDDVEMITVVGVATGPDLVLLLPIIEAGLVATLLPEGVVAVEVLAAAAAVEVAAVLLLLIEHDPDLTTVNAIPEIKALSMIAVDATWEEEDLEVRPHHGEDFPRTRTSSIEACRLWGLIHILITLLILKVQVPSAQEVQEAQEVKEVQVAPQVPLGEMAVEPLLQLVGDQDLCAETMDLQEYHSWCAMCLRISPPTICIRPLVELAWCETYTSLAIIIHSNPKDLHS